MLDIDHFKQLNDTHGHAAGDAVLRHFAAQLGQQLRPEDSHGPHRRRGVPARAAQHDAARRGDDAAAGARADRRRWPRPACHCRPGGRVGWRGAAGRHRGSPARAAPTRRCTAPSARAAAAMPAPRPRFARDAPVASRPGWPTASTTRPRDRPAAGLLPSPARRRPAPGAARWRRACTGYACRCPMR
ncbi:MAG: diguanylate cyclase [Comamonadaceae bacterium]|nr:diguanylate cyclase [Comamonadaceae bacterium]